MINIECKISDTIIKPIIDKDGKVIGIISSTGSKDYGPKTPKPADIKVPPPPKKGVYNS